MDKVYPNIPRCEYCGGTGRYTKYPEICSGCGAHVVETIAVEPVDYYEDGGVGQREAPQHYSDWNLP